MAKQVLRLLPVLQAFGVSLALATPWTSSLFVPRDCRLKVTGSAFLMEHSRYLPDALTHERLDIPKPEIQPAPLSGRDVPNIFI